MSATCNIVVLISGSGSNLQALIDSLDANNPARICAVVSNRAEAFGLQRAQAAGIATHLVRHKDYADREAFDAAMMDIIDTHQPNLVVLAGFMRILTPGFVRHYQGRLLNIHPSLLPKYKGLDTHRRALDAGDREHGCSVHFVTEELDGGPVAIQAAFTVEPGDSIDKLTERVHAAEHVIYPLAVRWFAEGRLRLAEQGAMLDETLLPATGHLLRI
ncbi:phosphoribosylglycinamide formyltransferase [Pseudomonas stutzeri]|jgi:phosphoribosylglycinamide formyltransferase 1|uniref:Phosphoribosylglycinamide formyltransferase n=1 Tax=Stutzerimonas stutzeri TaxID=316 RepID=A0A2N8SPH7_STUST|nr:phosphoribosylglycinamide formyltransferase [Stutzerimonas stutzeri]EQM75036.1 phosphoribosylglycinamide formyltransferase [Stutzerimonas stutzeri MF28]MCQ4248874.1 phosphoribosylglycinamide formyltransferase [Stutzerimonas stutzeri]PNG04393.1 phosphoribosylglycinamide formyltransferase [Stutzerimonas stutzeri]